jgi:glutamate racemase
MYNHPIGIFDSGVGGLSVLDTVRKFLPKESFVYLADQKNNPYGGRSTLEIKKLSSRALSFLVEKDVKIIIVACNTVSVSAIEYLRGLFKIPIIGVVPVVKTISEKSRTGKGAVLSTPATAKSEYLKKLIEKFADGVEIYTVGNSKLEHLVEKGIIEGPEVVKTLKDSLLPLLKNRVDSLALGCTHYPFLIPEMKKVVGERMNIYDSGGAIARRTRYVLSYESLLANEKKEDLYYTTGDPERFRKIAEKLTGETIAEESVRGIIF